MDLKFILIYHAILVTAVYITAYRTGFEACRRAFRCKTALGTAPLVDMLERLNLKVEDFLDERENDRRR